MKTKEERKQEFIRKATEKHGGRYDYSKVHYVNSKEKVEIICKEHGSFWQGAIIHSSGRGCPKCGIERSKKSRLIEDTPKEAKEILRQTIEFCGRFPTEEDLNNHKLTDFKRIRVKYGTPAIREWSGCYIITKSGKERKSRNYYLDINNVKETIKQNFPNLYEKGLCPSLALMKESGIDSIMKQFNTIQNLCNATGLKPFFGYKTRDGHVVYSMNEVFLDEYLYSRQIEHTIQDKPFKDKKYRCDFKVKNTYIEIWGLNDDDYLDKRKIKEKLYQENNLHLISIEYTFFKCTFDQLTIKLNGMFEELGFNTIEKYPFNMDEISKNIDFKWTEESIKEEILKYIERYGEENLSCNKMYKNGNGSLAWQIQTHFKGITYIKKLMNLEYRERMLYEDVLNKLKEICNTLGRFPKSNELEKKFIKRMSRFCDKNPIATFKEILGYDHCKKTHGYWHNENNIIDSIENKIKELGHFPSQKEMGNSLLNAVKQNGGINFYRLKMGYEPVIIEKTTNEDIIIFLENLIEEKKKIPTLIELEKIDKKKKIAIGKRGGLGKFISIIKNSGKFIKECDDYLNGRYKKAVGFKQ